MQPRLFNDQEHTQTSDDYYTPPWVFERMNIDFDLDVASPPGGIDWIPAKQYFTIEDDGLSQPWHGRVWMNPPYSNPKPWIERFIQHANGITLVPMTRGHWFNDLWKSDASFVIPDQKETLFKFVRDNKLTGIFMPVVFIAFGQECQTAISQLGRLR